jgi:glycosyltransferase involved in cell wall biosynthesis
MRLLCVHQNFPGQFRDLAPALVARGHEVKAISNSHRASDERIEICRYDLPKPERDGIHKLTAEVDEWIRRSELVAQQAEQLRQRGWAPDVMLAHPGWGESLLLRDVFPSTPLVLWPELWLKPEHMGVAPDQLGLEQKHYLRCKNGLLDAALAEAQAAVVPTAYQASCFPQRWQGLIELIHEGVPEQLFSLTRLDSLTLSETVTLAAGVPVVTFISRNLEPMRGFPTFMQALPRLQQLNPAVHVVIVGGDEVSYSAAPGEGQSWKQVLLDELNGQLDHSRIHWFGRIPHEELIKLYRRSNLHVYLSGAFVLSWSLTEVLACGTPVLAHANPMVNELIKPGVNGALYQGPPAGLGQAMAELLENKAQLTRWGEACRTALEPTFRQEQCMEKLEKLLQGLSNRF